MKREFRAKLNGDESHDDATASFTLPFDTREVWGKASSLWCKSGYLKQKLM
jgi:hypothetical protein